MSTFLVTGGAGFIGSNFCRLVLDRTMHRVVVLDSFTYAASQAAVSELDPHRVTVVEGDICDSALVTRLISSLNPSTDVVVHFAAESHNDNSLHSPERFVKTNITGTFNLIDAAARHHIRFHHISTDEVFGDLALDDPLRFTSNTAYNPSSPYSATKAGSDLLVRAWSRSLGLRATMSNCSNNYGPFQHVEKFIPRQITNLLDGGRVKVYGSGCNVRDWIHVRDHSAAVLRIIESGTNGSCYLVGAEAERSNLQVVRTLLKVMDRDPDDFDLVSDRPGHDLRYAIEPSVELQRLGWAPEYPDFEAGLSETVQWYRENEDWWRPQKEQTEARYAELGR